MYDHEQFCYKDGYALVEILLIDYSKEFITENLDYVLSRYPFGELSDAHKRGIKQGLLDA
ncbi:MAG: hypothetical protein WC679_01585 [Bacteroidales bacterium]|jgi:hypothetical protein